MTCAAKLATGEKANPTLVPVFLLSPICLVRVEMKESTVFDLCHSMDRKT